MTRALLLLALASCSVDEPPECLTDYSVASIWGCYRICATNGYRFYECDTGPECVDLWVGDEAKIARWSDMDAPSERDVSGRELSCDEVSP